MANELKLGNALVVGSLSADPGVAYNGEIYYNTTSNKFRKYENSTWSDLASSSGVTTIGTIDSQSKSANGLVIVGSNLYAQSADGSFPGLVTISSQTFAGVKSFSNDIRSTVSQVSNLGDSTHVWGGAFIQTHWIYDVPGTLQGRLEGNPATGVVLRSETLPLTLFTAPSGSSSQNVNISSGNASSGSSGDINLLPGTATTTRGTVQIGTELRLKGSTSGYVGLKATATPTSYTVIMPSAQGAASTFLQNDGSGNLSWTAATTAPAGADTDIQFNDAGVFGGNAAFTFNKTSGLFTTGVISIDQAYTSDYWGLPLPTVLGDSIAIGADNAMLFATTDASTDIQTADVGMQTGSLTVAAGTAKTGSLWLATGSVDDSGSSGASGLMDLETGSNNGSAASGTVTIRSGLASGSANNSGAVTFSSGNSTNGTSGQTNINSGGSTNGNSGHTVITTGNTPNGNSGSIQLIVGGVGGGTRGRIVMQDGTEGTSGYVWTSIDAFGSGHWMPAGSSGVTTIGTIDSQTKSANGLVIVSSNLYAQTADASFPGMVSTTAQTFAGVKTFRNDIELYDTIGTQVRAVLDSQIARPSGPSGPALYGKNSHLGIFTENAAATFDVAIETGNASAGASGWIYLQTGTASGTRGSISLSGQQINVLTATNLSMGSKKIVSLLDPTAAQDAATKNYVDTQIVNPFYLLKTGGTMSGAINMGSNQINNLSDPTSGQDAVTLAYMNARLMGLKPKESTRAASTANINLATGGLLTIDTIVLVDGDRVLVKNQTAPEENGIYNAHSGSWTRSTDFDSLSPIDEINGSWVAVQEGSQAGQVWVQYGIVVVLGTDPINFEYFNPIAGLIGGDMITFTGSTFSVDLATASGLESTNPGNVGGQLRVKLEATNPTLKFTGSNELAVKLDPAGAIASGASGLAAQVDNSTIDISSNQLEVKTGGITNTQVNASAAIAFTKLAALTADRIPVTNPSGFITDNSSTSPSLIVNKLKFGPSSGNIVEEQYVHAITIPDNQSSAAAVDASLTFDYSVYAGYRAEYYIKDGSSPSITRMGALSLVSNDDGSIASLTDQSNDTADIGITFSAVTNGGNIELRAVSTNSGSARTMRVKITRFLI